MVVLLPPRWEHSADKLSLAVRVCAPSAVLQCTLSVSTADSGGIDDVVVFAAFEIYGYWREPLLFFMGDIEGGSTLNITYTLDWEPTQLMLKLERTETNDNWGIWRIVLASVLMGVVLWAVSALLTPAFGLGGWRWLALLGLIASGTLAYFLLGQLLGAFRIAEFKAAMRR